ncbi:hypothetical protein CIC12_23135 [Burkholderia sp. SG-MS1]|nr:hypothetical protein [Paraburkholderia sp. SG-MS1]
MTSRIYNGQSLRAEDAGWPGYLDGRHKDHLEVFDGNGNFKSVVNLDGSVSSDKTNAASGRKLNVK